MKGFTRHGQQMRAGPLQIALPQDAAQFVADIAVEIGGNVPDAIRVAVLRAMRVEEEVERLRLVEISARMLLDSRPDYRRGVEEHNAAFTLRKHLEKP